MRPGAFPIVGGWLMMKLAPTSSEYSEWSFFDDDCTGLQATRVYHGMPTGDGEDAGEVVAFDTCSTVTESIATSYVIYRCENNEVVVTAYTDDTCDTALETTTSPYSSCQDRKMVSCSTTSKDPEWTVLDADRWSSATSFYLDEECTTPDGGVVVVDQAMAMELYGFGGSCGKDEARNRNMALGCINGEVQAAYYASTDTKCSGDWIFMDISPSSCRKRPSNGWVPSGSTWDGFVQSICGETYVGANDIASSSPDNSSDPPATAPKRAVSADCAGKSSIAGSDVILLMGQSNMSGRGSGYQESIDGPLNPRIQQWSRDNKIITASEHLEHGDLAADTLTKVGMGTAFGRAYVGNLQAQRKVLLVPTAEGSTALVGAAWSPGGKMFEEAVQRTNAALASDVGNCIAAVLWHQGERDINAGIDQDTYRLAWMDMIATLRTRIPAIAKAPVVLGEFAPAWIASEPELTAPVLAAIRSIPEHVEFTAVVSSAGLSSNYGDIRHFNAVAQRELGKRYFDKLGDAKSNTDRANVGLATDLSAPAFESLSTAAPVARRGDSSTSKDTTSVPTRETAGANGSGSAISVSPVHAIFSAAVATALTVILGACA